MSVATCPISGFFERLPALRHRALLLDYDGTVAPFNIERSKAVPYPGTMESLQRIAGNSDTRLVFITGRSAGELAGLLQPYRLKCEIWGMHGWERLTADGSYTTAEESPNSLLIQHADELLQMEGLGELVELKPAAVAVHYRGLGLDLQREARAASLRVFASLSTRTRHRILEFDGGIEFILGNRDKGDAVRAILAEMPAQNAIAYLGDDATDEDAFRALPRHGLSVLVRREFRPTAAQAWLRPPEELMAFFQQWESACGGAA